MKPVNKTAALINPVNAQKIDELCKSITDSCDNPLGWEQLTKLSGFTHSELIALFQVYKQTTPMAYIKNARNLNRITSLNSSHHHTLPKLLQDKVNSEKIS